jgi:hypothetical protein
MNDLLQWKDIMLRNKSAFDKWIKLFDTWHKQYSGAYTLAPVTDMDYSNDYDPLKKGLKAPIVTKGPKPVTVRHIRRVIAELIEATIDSAVPQPKVKAMRPQDEGLARLIEEMIRDELDRLPMEELNDLMERVVPICGGGAWLVEWDSAKERGDGAISVQCIHPSLLVPQAGVTGSIEDMDHIIVKFTVTKDYVKKRYGKDITEDGDSEPDITEKGPAPSAAEPERDESAGDDGRDTVSLYRAYYRNEKGGIGVFAWVGSLELENEPGYYKRDLESEQELLTKAIIVKDASGEPVFLPAGTGVPFYTPDVYPIVLQKNVSSYGKLLGDSDVEKVIDQQNLISRLEQKITDKLFNGGSVAIIPPQASLDMTTEDNRVWRLEGAGDVKEIGHYDFEGNVQQDLTVVEATYQAARDILGITDSYQGKNDPTATSGVAKKFAAQQSAGRLESRRVMKRAAWAHIFELIFKLRLAYTDKPLAVRIRGAGNGDTFDTFARYKFLEIDDAGELIFNDRFLFSCDQDAPLANNRESRWQDMFNFYSAGVFGNPQDPATALFFWTELSELHYPGSERILAMQRQRVEQIQEQQRAMQQQQIQAQEQQRMQDMQAQDSQAQRELEIEIDAAARQDAARDVGAAFERRQIAQPP